MEWPSTVNDTARPVEVFALPTGQLSHPDRWIFEDGDEDWMHARHVYPNFSFLIRHHSGKNILFDLGLTKVRCARTTVFRWAHQCHAGSKVLNGLDTMTKLMRLSQDPEKLPQVIRDASQWIEPTATQDVLDLLEEGSKASGQVLDQSDITAILLSHLHFDHVGDCTKFPDTDIVAGPGSRAAASPGWPKAKNSPFPSAVLEHSRYKELSFDTNRWVPLGPFPRALDYFGDGSFFLLDTPGHMPGHLGGLALTANAKHGQKEWVFMGGDCCHHRSLLIGSRPMSVTVGPAGTPCFHKDPNAAKETIEKIRTLEKSANVLVALAHDHYLKGCMPEYPQSLNGWLNSSWKKDLDTILENNYPGHM